MIALIQTAKSENGANVKGIAQTLNASESDVRAVVDELANLGHIYSTIDDDHFKMCA